MQPFRLGILLVLTIAVVPAHDATASQNDVNPRWVHPSTTDPTIVAHDEPHYVVTPPSDVVPRGELFLFFPGTGGFPADYTELLDHAAGLGYDAIALTYANDLSINLDLCAGTTDPSCHERARREIKEGRDLHASIDVPRVDCIEHRLVRLLAWLATHSPEERWSIYAPGETPDWTRLAVAGHSQGGGHAGFIARNHAVARCLVFSGADWFGAEQRVADWLRWPAVTPPRQIYGFTHARDVTPSLAVSREIWTAYGLDAFGPEMRVDNRDDYDDSHRLFTLLEPSSDDRARYHNATAVNRSLPRDATGRNLLEPVWTYLLTHRQIGPGQRIANLEAADESIIDLEFSPEGSWGTWQDSQRRLWVARFDPETGMVQRDDSRQMLDTDLSPIPDSRQGPEFLLAASGQQILYTRTLGDGRSIWRVRAQTDGTWGAPERISPADGRERGGILTTADRRWERPAIVYWLDDGYTGTLCWTWLDDPVWTDRPLGPTQPLSTQARWAPDGQHLFVTLPAGVGNEEAPLHVLDTQTGQLRPLDTGNVSLVNPFVTWLPGETELLVGGVASRTQLHLFRFQAGDHQLGFFAAVPAPTEAAAQGYDQLASPEVFSWADRRYVVMEVAKGEAGGAPDAQIWVAELPLPGAERKRIELRVDDRVVGARRLDPEVLVTPHPGEVFAAWHQVEPPNGIFALRARTGLALFANPQPLRFDVSDDGLTLFWDDRSEPRLFTSPDLRHWEEIPAATSPHPWAAEASGLTGWFQLTPP